MRCNSYFFALLSTVSHFVMLPTQFLLQLFRHRSFICTMIDRQDNWCSVEFIFKMAKRRGDKMNITFSRPALESAGPDLKHFYGAPLSDV